VTKLKGIWKHVVVDPFSALAWRTRENDRRSSVRISGVRGQFEPFTPPGNDLSHCFMTTNPQKLFQMQFIKPYEEFYLLGYNAVQSVVSQPTFRRNISPQSSGSKKKPSKKPA
jgi:hypothetical protein